MDRLTTKQWRNLDPWECCGQDHYCKRGCHDKGGCNNGCVVPRQYTRLAQYEDTGFAPDEILTALEMAKMYSAIKKLDAYQTAEADGSLVRLPCKVGDTVYYVTFGKVYSSVCHCVTIHDNAIQVHLYDYDGANSSHAAKNVFLTREEAEVALKTRRKKV